uniref:DUF424 family protein n=1 Tax=Staphylothermus marinus TaxID=2280 RepID=A0A7C4HCL2_STAMA
MNSDKLVYVKKHVSGSDVIIAICDYELIGMKIVDNEKNISIYVDPFFYQGDLLTIDEALKLLSQATIVNLIGKNIVEAVVKLGLVLKETVVEIAGIPHVQLVNMGVD